ncbi:MAG: BON domain-containing protein [Oceanospirillaceae bacterium]|jgi:osmotically-inducible protein OsmY|nr:BON domain-containing protein [Oceanospirillaceae bacterium]
MKKLAIALIATSTLLAGCSDLISATREEPIRENVGSRTVGNFIEDEAIELKALVNISKGSAPLSQSHINVTSFNGQVLLTGQVPNESIKNEAKSVVEKVRDVRKIHNELEIAGPTSTIVRSNDVYLTSRIKLQLLADKAVEGLRIKVVTENGIVYLMGLVSQSEADRAVSVVRSVPGVQRIVKVFEYVPLP